MKKVISICLVLLITLTICIPTVFASGAALTVNATVDNITKMVTVSGNVSSGEGKQVTITILYPTEILYLNQISCDENGNYRLSYLLNNPVAGVYKVKVAENGGSSPVTTEFTYVGSMSVIPVANITVRGTDAVNTITIKNGALQMQAEVTPSNATNKAVTWTVENGTGSATISENGLLTAIADGTVSVKATAKDSSSVFGTCVITISGQTVVSDNTPTPVAEEANSSTDTIKLEAKVTGTIAKAVTDMNMLTKAFDKAIVNVNGEKTVYIEMKEVATAREYVVEFPREIFSANQKKLEILTPLGTIEVPDNMFKPGDIEKAYVVAISIASPDVTKLDKSIQGKIVGKPVIELNVMVDGKKISWSNPNVPVEISIDYKPTEVEIKNPDSIVVWYIDGNGKIQSVPSGRYNSTTGKVTFKTIHFSKYAIVYNYKTFIDAGKFNWAQKQIEVLVSKGIMAGKSETQFRPEMNITRAEFIDALVKALDLSAQFDSNFNDVKKTSSYYESVGIAKKLGITYGTGGDKFSPDSEISRQEMATFVVKAMKLQDTSLVIGTASDLKKYKDASKIAEYALGNMATMVRNGILEGYGDKINPLEKTTRAQTAVILYKLYSKN